MGFTSFDHFHPGSNVARPTSPGAQVDQVDVPVPGERANLVGSIEPLSFRLAHRLPSFSLFPGFRASPEDTDRPAEGYAPDSGARPSCVAQSCTSK